MTLFISNPRLRASRYRADLIHCFAKFLDDGSYVLGSGVQDFEKAFAAYTNISHCVTVANGTDALELALKSIGIGPNDRVATAANAGGYSSAALSAIGAIPHYLDVDPVSCCISLNALESSFYIKPKALIVTHLYGRIAPQIKAIADFCREHEILLVEDCAQAHGSRLGGQHAGSFGVVGTFSFYPTKNLGGLGDGGAVCTADPSIAARCRQLRQYGWDTKYHVQLAGGRNSRLDELQARFLEILLPDLDQENQKRIILANRYHQYIDNPDLVLPSPSEDESSHVYHLFVVYVRRGRDWLRAYLESHGILSDVHYPVADHLQPVLWTDEIFDCPIAEDLAAHLLTIPCYPDMALEDQDIVISAINNWRPRS